MGGMAGRLANPALAGVMPKGSSEGRTRPSTTRPSPVADSRLIKTPFGTRLEGRPSPVRGGDAMTRPGFPVRGGGGVPLQGPGGVMVRPERPVSKGLRRKMGREDRRVVRDAMRDERMKERIMSKYDRMSSRFPGYKPTLASPVDTRDELKSFKMGLRDYRKANPDVKPVKPMRPGAIPPPVVPVIPPNQPAMRGGGLARKGVGMALAKGGLVKANGCAQRGKTKGKMT